MRSTLRRINLLISSIQYVLLRALCEENESLHQVEANETSDKGDHDLDHQEEQIVVD